MMHDTGIGINVLATSFLDSHLANRVSVLLMVAGSVYARAHPKLLERKVCSPEIRVLCNDAQSF